MNRNRVDIVYALEVSFVTASGAHRRIVSTEDRHDLVRHLTITIEVAR